MIIDVDTSYNALLGRPWMHNNFAIPSTYHQCIKYPLPKSRNEGTIVADNDPFSGIAAYYADARFYVKRPQKKDECDKNLQVPTKRTFRYVPQSERKPGASALTPINPTLELKNEFVLPLRKTECTLVET